LQENGGFFLPKKLLQKVEVTRKRGIQQVGTVRRLKKLGLQQIALKVRGMGAQVGTFVCQNRRSKPTLCGSHFSCVH
jgi:hypothetical protein